LLRRPGSDVSGESCENLVDFKFEWYMMGWHIGAFHALYEWAMKNFRNEKTIAKVCEQHYEEL